MSVSDVLQWLSAKLYPNGRAFRVPESDNAQAVYTSEDGYGYSSEDGVSNYANESGYKLLKGFLFTLHKSINRTFTRAWGDLKQVYSDIFPNDPNFTIDDAHDWYRRFGMYDSGSVSLPAMKLALLQRMSWPQVPLNRQNYLYIQQQLQAAGFPVYVFENRWWNGSDWVTKSPSSFVGTLSGVALCASATRVGMYRCGQDYTNNLKCVNYLEQVGDSGFDVGANYRCVFFISSATFGGGTRVSSGTRVGSATHIGANTLYARVPLARKQEFKQLLIKLKPAHTVGYLFVNYY